MYTATLLLVLSKRLALGAMDIVLYLVVLSVALLSYLANVDSAAPTSLLLLCVIWFPFCFKWKSNPHVTSEWFWVVRAFLGMCTFVAVCGISQYFGQFVIRGLWVIDFTPYIPEWLRSEAGYNTAIEIGSHYKSNGFFLLEPSGFSQMMAVGLICEWTLFRRISRLILFSLGLAVSYSGTGIFVLLLASMFPLRWKTVGRALGLFVIGQIAYLLLNPYLDLSFTLNRLNEFNSTGSSGSDRFIAPFRLLQEQFTISGDLVQMLLGNGPGATTRTTRNYTFFDPTWVRLLFEYGLIGSLAFLCFIGRAFTRFTSPVEIRAGLFFCWLLMGDGLLTPGMPALIFLLAGLWPRAVSTEQLRCRRKWKLRFNPEPTLPVGAETPR